MALFGVAPTEYISDPYKDQDLHFVKGGRRGLVASKKIERPVEFATLATNEPFVEAATLRDRVRRERAADAKPWRTTTRPAPVAAGRAFATFSGPIPALDPRPRETPRPAPGSPSARRLPDLVAGGPSSRSKTLTGTRRTILPAETFGGTELLFTETATRARSSTGPRPSEFRAGSTTHMNAERDREIMVPVNPKTVETVRKEREQTLEATRRARSAREAAPAPFHGANSTRPTTINPFPEHMVEPYGGDPEKLQRARARAAEEKAEGGFRSGACPHTLWFRPIATHVI